MHSIDLHCDALYKLQESGGTLSFRDSEELDVNLERLKEGNVKVQAFAIYVDPSRMATDNLFDLALEQVRYYRGEVLGKNPEMKQILNWDEIEQLGENEIGSFLTLEGVDVIGNDLNKLNRLLDMGVLSVGLTWNPANLAADGIEEPRGAGLTAFGFDIVRRLNERKIFVDVSHLSVKGFWEVMQAADYPIATHSNVLDICGHVRNLNNEQIQALVKRDAMIHAIYNPAFVVDDGHDKTVTIDDLVRHIEAMVELGAIKNIGFGSDFDGIRTRIKGLAHSGEVPNLIEALKAKFTEEEVQGFAYQNFLNHLPK